MKKKVIIISSVVVGLLLVGYFLFIKSDPENTKFSYVQVSKGDLNVLISSTGTLQAVKTVEVGTQVSGKIDRMFVDFNSSVRKGQLLAVLDTVVLAAAVKDAQANLDKAKAQFNQAIAVHERNKQLYEKKFMNEVDFIASKTNVETLLANLKSAQTALERANLNLGYAYIYAPISGTIINRAVEQGQTVAASLSAPTLFTIAENLSNMWILASVDESDIGQIKVGDKATFTVQAYPDKTFEGEVIQIRLNPNVVSNVVNYTVVVKADNKEKLLLPGMTATVDFYVDHRQNVLLVPNVALRFQPTDAMMEEYRKNMEKEMASLPDSVKKKFQGRQGGQWQSNSGGMGGGQFGNGAAANGARRRNMNRLWYLDEKGNLKMSPVMIGLTDGKNTEIVRGRNITEGMKVISGVSEDATSQSSSSNVFNPQQSGPRFGRGF